MHVRHEAVESSYAPVKQERFLPITPSVRSWKKMWDQLDKELWLTRQMPGLYTHDDKWYNSLGFGGGGGDSSKARQVLDETIRVI